MKYFSILLLIILNLSSCKIDKKKTESNKINESESQSEVENIEQNTYVSDTKKESIIISDDRLNLDEILSSDINDYIASFSDGALSMCCYDEIIDLSESIIRSNFEKDIEIYNPEGNIDTVFVYKSKKSFFKEYYNNHPKVDRMNLVYGEILDEKDLDDKRAEIGLSKIKFLQQFFNPTEVLNEVKQFSISEDELGEAETIFKFEDDKLKVIIFNSSYDWINKNLKE